MTFPSAEVGLVGRHAARPTGIPLAGWRDIAWRVYTEIFEDRLMLVAAGTTFYGLLALIPALTAAISVYGLIADASTVSQQLGSLSAIVPGQALATMEEHLTRIAHKRTEQLGVTFIVSLFFAIWAANAGMKALFEAMNVVFEEREERSFIWLTAVTLFATIAGIALFVVTMLVLVALPSVLTLLGLDAESRLIARIVSATILLFAVWIAVVALYRWGPDRKQARWRWLTPGATFTLVTGGLGSMLFSVYLNNFSSYDQMYGSLGAIIAFMTWLWVMATLLLVGAEISAEIEHQTSFDSTVGPSRVLGERGARMADSIGPSLTGSHRTNDNGGAPVDTKPDPEPQSPIDLLPMKVGGLVILTILGLVLRAGGSATGKRVD